MLRLDLMPRKNRRQQRDDLERRNQWRHFSRIRTQELFHNFVDFKKAFDRIWHDGLWRDLREHNIDNGLIEVIRSLYDEATSASAVWLKRYFRPKYTRTLCFGTTFSINVKVYRVSRIAPIIMEKEGRRTPSLTPNSAAFSFWTRCVSPSPTICWLFLFNIKAVALKMNLVA